MLRKKKEIHSVVNVFTSYQDMKKNLEIIAKHANVSNSSLVRYAISSMIERFKQNNLSAQKIAILVMDNDSKLVREEFKIKED
jgi:hypothetical protein